MNRNQLNCLRCGGEIHLIKQERIQLGKTGWLFGDLDNLLAGALDVDILGCPDCGKLEFFRGDWSGLAEDEENAIAQIKCPRCGRRHDMDDPKCPCCGAVNTML